MGWLADLFSNKKRQKEEEAKELQKIIMQSNETMNRMQKTIEGLERRLMETHSEVAVALETERERFIEEERERRMEEEREQQKKAKASAEKFVSIYLTKYLDRYKIVNNRFSLTYNLKLVTNPDDLVFKLSQMYKLGFPRMEHVIVFDRHVIKIEVEFDSPDIWFSLDGGENLCTETVGIKCLQKFIEAINVDILSLPSVQTHRIYKVKDRNYKYVLAKDEKECRFIIKDKDSTCEIEEVASIETEAFVRNLKSNLVYSPIKEV
jgi:hypothetical protein